MEIVIERNIFTTEEKRGREQQNFVALLSISHELHINSYITIIQSYDDLIRRWIDN